MPGIKTSRVFYRRGVSNDNRFFGFAVQANYPIVQPPRLYNSNLITNSSITPTPIPPTPPTPDNTVNSILFDGSSNYLNYDGLILETSPFTIQCWFYVNSFLGRTRQIILGATFGSTNGLSFSILGNDTIVMDRLGVSATQYAIPTLEPNTWYYLAYVRDTLGNSTVYLNSTRSTTGVVSDNNNYALTNNIGCWTPIENQSSDFFNGYISNLCITSEALYNPTNPFLVPPVPTEPLVATSTTQLLLNTKNSDNNIIDTSPNNFPIYGIGNPGPQISNLSPF